MERRRRKKNTYNTNTMLILIVAVLAVVLVTVLGVAIHFSNTNHQASQNPNDNGGSTSSSSGNAALSVQPDFDAEKATVAEYVKFSGSSDPSTDVLVNGTAVTRNHDGTFQVSVPLQVGVNQIVFTHKGETVTYQVERRFVIQSYAPAGNATYNSGATVRFEVVARKGSQVKATFNGKEITLELSNNQASADDAAEGFVLYEAAYKLTSTNTTDLSLGKITFTATNGDVTETCQSGEITCQKAAQILGSDPSVTPSYGDYINVGSGYIAEIVNYNAETFDGDTKDDYSHPTNNYLPKGTVDYCSTNTLKANGSEYITLRCGRRVYVEKPNYPPTGTRVQVTDCYKGTLPDHNEIQVVSMERSGRHTILTLDCLWKAPFYFDLLPQRYSYPDAGANREYAISSFTATYIDITFCYATVFEGTVEIAADDPLFKSAELIRRDSDCTLRLHLKKTGGFYGWDSYYNEEGQLCFQFLNPTQVTATTENQYGADLSGVLIMIDVGHGKDDPGASAVLNGVTVNEAQCNLLLSNQLKTKLESMGATVVLNRDKDVNLPVDERILSLIETAPDLCVAIHQNTLDGWPNWGGYEGWYYTPFSYLPSKQICERTEQTGLYARCKNVWDNYYVGRQTVCPVALTENGFMSHLPDLGNMVDPQAVERKAEAIAQGVADYFLIISGLKND